MHDPVTLVGGMVIEAHPMISCAGARCSIHNPSSHHMRAWEQLWEDVNKTMYRVCPHKVPHPDPDHLAFAAERHGFNATLLAGMHHCDGCCRQAIDGEIVNVRVEPSSSASASPAAILPGPSAALPSPEPSPSGETSPSSSSASQTDSDPYQA